nr:reverse transcriptase domain-containing protein [Tanacetum cinerariifolium]
MEIFFQIFHDLHFDISFANALLLMPKFASTIKSLLTNKDKLFELAKVPLNENCSAMLLKKLPEKLGDPGKFLIPYRSITRPKGVAEDIFVKVEKFHFPTDFVVVDFEVDPRVPLILGRSFLRIGRVLIDVYREEITLRVNDESGDILYLEKLLNDDPFQLPPMDLKQVKETKAKSLIEEPPELELKELPPYLEYAFLEESDKLLVDKAKVDVIAKLPHPTNIKGVRSFLGHDGFYRRFIQDFSKIARPMTHLLEEETPFVFSKDCIDAFKTLKKNLIEASIVVVPNWNLPFELMCDASDFAIGAVLGQRNTKHFQPIHYASKTITNAQIHYTITEKQMLSVVYAFEKFRPYLVLTKSIVYMDHSALKYLLSKQDAKLKLIRWVLLLLEFDITIRDKNGSKNLVADHLSRLENPHKDVFENKDINENFPSETLGSISS